MGSSEVEALALRVARLEQGNRRLRALGIGVIVALVALVSGAAGRKPRIMELEKLVIRDSHGRARLTIGTPGSAGVAIDLGRDEPAIWLSDESGGDRAILTSDGLHFANGRARPILAVTAGPNGPELRLYGPDGKVTWSAR
jgi:hypothetical protein